MTGAANRAFALLTCPPSSLAFDARGIAGLPSRILDLAELRKHLTDEADPPPQPVSDAAWRHLVVRARRDGPEWVVAAIGVAIPGLKRAAGRLAAGWHGDRSDVDAEMLTGFLARLKDIDADAPRVYGRLLDAAGRAGRKARHDDTDGQVVHVDWAGIDTAPDGLPEPSGRAVYGLRASSPGSLFRHGHPTAGRCRPQPSPAMMGPIRTTSAYQVPDHG